MDIPTVSARSSDRWRSEQTEELMSSANKEISRRFTELFSTGDETLAAEVLSPDVVFSRHRR